MRGLLAREKGIVNFMCFPGGSVYKESSCNVGVENLGLIPGLVRSIGKIHWRREWQPTPVFLPGESPWTEEYSGYSPWGHKESDMTQQLNTAQQNFMCKLDWATGPDTQLKVISGCVYEAISGWDWHCISRLSKVDCPPVGRPHPPLKAQMEQKAK